MKKSTVSGIRPEVNTIKLYYPPQMTKQQIEGQSQQLEARVETLEKELAKIKQTLAESLKRKEPWWLKVAGSFENDPTFDEAVRFGQEWRK